MPIKRDWWSWPDKRRDTTTRCYFVSLFFCTYLVVLVKNLAGWPVSELCSPSKVSDTPTKTVLYFCSRICSRWAVIIFSLIGLSSFVCHQVGKLLQRRSSAHAPAWVARACARARGVVENCLVSNLVEAACQVSARQACDKHTPI
jgi:hypothetical protein